MKIDDYDSVYNLWLSCKGMGLNTTDDSKEGIEKFLDRNSDTCFVAIIEEKIVGVIIVGNDGRRAYVYHTAVHPDYRRQKIAEALVNEAMNAIKNIGISKVALVVFERNEVGNIFWKKMGFTQRDDLVYRNKSLILLERIDT